jgi:hypothetical protein
MRSISDYSLARAVRKTRHRLAVHVPMSREDHRKRLLKFYNSLDEQYYAYWKIDSHARGVGVGHLGLVFRLHFVQGMKGSSLVKEKEGVVTPGQD